MNGLESLMQVNNILESLRLLREMCIRDSIVILGIRACTLDGAIEGIKFLFLPKFSELTSQGVLSALGQAFFSLSIGMGVLLTYASYIKKDEKLTSISLQVICADTLIAVLAGIAIFPAVFAFNIAPDSGPGLVFLTLPQVFQSMAFGQLWALSLIHI